MKVNFLSGTGGYLPPLPRAIAKMEGGPNQVMDMALKSNIKRFLGITLLDFPGTSLIKGIINSNFG